MSATPDSKGVIISRGELLWITISTWLGGVFMLTLLPMLLVPRFGIALGLTIAYVVFFLAWQPVQVISQRLLGPRAAMIRMLALVGSAAIVAFYLREALASVVAAG